MGGQLIAIATDGVGASASATSYIVGSQIPNSQITTQLTNLYNPGFQGYTPTLLCLIALQESAYAQFSTKQPSSLYGVNARWPKENFSTTQVPAGSYIGLMQVAVTMPTAWDWYQNSIAGNNIFMGFAAQVITYQNTQMANIKGLPAMTGTQIEDSVLVMYGGFVDHSTNPAGKLHYYIPGTDNNGHPIWVLSPGDSLVSGEGITPTQYIYGGGTNSSGNPVTGVRQQVIPN